MRFQHRDEHRLHRHDKTHPLNTKNNPNELQDLIHNIRITMKPLSRPATALVCRARPTLFSQLPSQSPWRCCTSSRRTYKTETLYKTNSGKMTEPLRILFCGSDNVSTESLHALHEEYVHNRELVESIDVCVLPPKFGGRGMKEKVIGESKSHGCARSR